MESSLLNVGIHYYTIESRIHTGIHTISSCLLTTKMQLILLIPNMPPLSKEAMMFIMDHPCVENFEHGIIRNKQE